MKFSKNEKWKNEKLNLFFQTTNEFSIKRSIKRSRKILIIIEENHIESQIISKSIAKHLNLLFNKTIVQKFIQNENNFDHMNIEKKNLRYFRFWYVIRSISI